LPVEYGEIREFVEDLIRVRIDSQFDDDHKVFKKSKYGFANKKGEIVIPCELLELTIFVMDVQKLKSRECWEQKKVTLIKKGIGLSNAIYLTPNRLIKKP
jgi:hypothetical protein